MFDFIQTLINGSDNCLSACLQRDSNLLQESGFNKNYTCFKQDKYSNVKKVECPIFKGKKSLIKRLLIP